MICNVEVLLLEEILLLAELGNTTYSKPRGRVPQLSPPPQALATAAPRAQQRAESM